MQVINPNTYTRHLSPGKFEGETPATEYYWEQMGDGETIYEPLLEETEECFDAARSAELFHINAEESEAFGLPIGHWFMLREDSQGFVLGSVHDSREEAEKAFQNWLGL